MMHSNNFVVNSCILDILLCISAILVHKSYTETCSSSMTNNLVPCKGQLAVGYYCLTSTLNSLGHFLRWSVTTLHPRKASYRLITSSKCTFFRHELTTAPLGSAEEFEWPLKYFHDQKCLMWGLILVLLSFQAALLPTR